MVEASNLIYEFMGENRRGVYAFVKIIVQVWKIKILCSNMRKRRNNVETNISMIKLMMDSTKAIKMWISDFESYGFLKWKGLKIESVESNLRIVKSCRLET